MSAAQRNANRRARRAPKGTPAAAVLANGIQGWHPGRELAARPRTYEDIPAERAARATDVEHVAAIAAVACPICGAAAGVECAYGDRRGPQWIGREFVPAPRTFPGRAHTRRVRAYIATLPEGT